MIRVQRLIFYFISVVFIALVSYNILLSLKTTSSTSKSVTTSELESNIVTSLQSEAPSKKSDPNEEKYLSWFPHSDFPEQHEGFRNALRLAVATNRTIIAPLLRINKVYPWLPFEDLAKRYEAQDKTELKQLCASKTQNWQTELEPCDTINDWIEIPWSSIMDLEVIKAEYGIKIIERTNGHGWGVHESALGGNIDPDDVAIMDVMSYKENGTSWEHIDSEKEERKAKESKVLKWIQSTFVAPKSDEEFTGPFQFVLPEDQLLAIDAKILQFGALSSAGRYPTPPSEILSKLRKALIKTRFLIPNKMTQLTQQSIAIIDILGGKNQYSTLFLNLTTLAALDSTAGSTIQSLAGDGDSSGNQDQAAVTIDDLSEKSKKELMGSVALETFGDIPINQAVSGALPIQPSTGLSDILERGVSNTPEDRRLLLEACVDYHLNVETKYPVYYLINDMGIAPETRMDIFAPLINMFPCTFSIVDMLNWGIQTDTWANGQPGLNDTSVNYEKLLQPLLDILIAERGYSVFELPPTGLSRFLHWTVKS